jgi:hypothetical protein
MARHYISKSDQKLVFKLEKQLGERRFRDLMQRADKYDRPISYDRFGRMKEGRAILTDDERRRLEILDENSKAITSLGRTAERLGKRDYRINKSIRDWLLNVGTQDELGKYPKGTKTYNKIASKGLKGLGYLGVDPEKWKEFITSPQDRRSLAELDEEEEI